MKDLKQLIKESGYSHKYLSSKMQISKTTFWRRINDPMSMTVSEATKLSEILNCGFRIRHGNFYVN